MMLVDMITEALDHCESVVGMFLDFLFAFDTADYDIYLLKWINVEYVVSKCKDLKIICLIDYSM